VDHQNTWWIYRRLLSTPNTNPSLM